MDTFFDGVWRMDWGLGNPNKTAALIAMLMVAVWCLARFRAWGFWVATLLFTGLGVCLMHTFSRGGLLAAIIGMLPLVWVCGKRMTKPQWIAVACSLAMVIASAFVLDADKRFRQGIAGEEDLSITNRLEMWKVAPRMILDAPSGWGLGNSGEAYMQWYQAPEKLEGYRTLVNSHLTWLVELGWDGRILYIFGWGFIATLLLPSQRNPVLAGALGLWTSFFVSAFFSSVAESVWLWIPPLIALVVAVVLRFNASLWPRKPSICVTFGFASVVLLAIIVTGLSVETPSGHKVRKRGSVVLLSEEPAQVWILVNEGVMGRFYGRQWRLLVDPGGDEIAFIQRIDDLPKHGDAPILVIGGRISDQNLAQLPGLSGSHIIFLNPRFNPSNLSTSPMMRLSVIRGSFFTDTWIYEWDQFIPSGVVLIQGAGEYLPEWPMLVINAMHPASEAE